MSIQLVPDVKIPESAIKTALMNLVEGFAELLKEEALTLANDWAEEAGIEAPNIFMREKAESLLSSIFIGYNVKVQPTPSQWTGDHVEAYYRLPLLPPPSAPKPEPLSE